MKFCASFHSSCVYYIVHQQYIRVTVLYISLALVILADSHSDCGEKEVHYNVIFFLFKICYLTYFQIPKLLNIFLGIFGYKIDNVSKYYTCLLVNIVVSKYILFVYFSNNVSAQFVYPYIDCDILFCPLFYLFVHIVN